MSLVCRPAGGLEVSDSRLLPEIDRADYRLQIAICLVDHVAREIGYRVCWTCIERTFEQTQDIYQRAGMTPPSGPGVHDVRPCRGADGSHLPIPGAARSHSEEEAGELIAARVNELTDYPRNFDTVIYHRVLGARHLHVQVPWDGLAFEPPAPGQTI